MNNTSDKQKINELVQRLSVPRVKREKITVEEDAIHTELLFISSEHQVTIGKAVASTPPNTNRQDREGNIIEIGDTVEFLTPTKFAGNTGVVHSFSPLRVTSLNKDKRKVVKSSHNLAIVQKQNLSADLLRAKHGNHSTTEE